MKNAFFIVCAGLLLSVSAEAQKTKTKVKTSSPKVNVPENIKGSFATNYEGVKDTKWSKNYTGNYVANFTDSTSLKQSLEYNAKGDKVKTTTTYDIAALPPVITTALQTSYADAKVIEASKVEVPGVSPFYKVKIERGENKKQKQLLISEDGLITE
jgi:hypothetical protein